MTNPDNTVGTNAGYDGRTTPNAFNDILQGWSTAGVISGWKCSPKAGMTVQLGGDGNVRDVAIAENNSGDRTTINNRTATPVEITLAGAPATGNRYDTIVAYVDGAQSGQGATDVDFPSITGIIAVSGTAATNPNYPTDAQIRTAITNDGADGASAYYVPLADILVGQGVTTIGSGVIGQGTIATPANVVLDEDTVASYNIQSNAVTSTKINWSSIPYYQGVWSGSNPLGAGWTSELTVNIATPGTYALIGNVRTANRKGSNTGYASRIATSGTTVMSAQGRWWGAAGEVHDMPCYAVAKYTTAGTATVQAITDDTYQEHCVELATLIAIRIA